MFQQPKEAGYGTAGLNPAAAVFDQSQPPNDFPHLSDHGSCSEGSTSLGDRVFALNPMEATLIQSFRRLPDDETRTSFVDVLQEAMAY
jgi:hypothetical protein